MLVIWLLLLTWLNTWWLRITLSNECFSCTNLCLWALHLSIKGRFWWIGELDTVICAHEYLGPGSKDLNAGTVEMLFWGLFYTMQILVNSEMTFFFFHFACVTLSFLFSVSFFFYFIWWVGWRAVALGHLSGILCIFKFGRVMHYWWQSFVLHNAAFVFNL